MSKKTIKVGANLVLAGQLLANELVIGHEFDGSSFRYVPFDPPIVDLSTADGVKTLIVEGHERDTVKITLDKAATTLIDFDYCFVFEGTKVGKDPNGEAMLGDIVTTIPLFNETTQKCDNPSKGYFDIGGKNLRTPIVLTAENDGIEEGQEHFRIRIENLNAATLKDGSHDGFIDLYIDDPDLPELTFEKDTLKSIDENPEPEAVIDTLRGIHGKKGCDDCEYSLSDTSHYSDFVTVDEQGVVRVKDSAKFDYEQVRYIDIQVHVVDVANHMEADTTVIIPIGDVNELPILEDQEFEIDEHQAARTVIGTLVWGENDSASVFRQDVFTAVGGDTSFIAVSSTGVITTKKEFDYETQPHTYTVDVRLADKNDPTLSVVRTVTVHVRNVNENPKITTETVTVTENTPKGTVVDTLEAIDLDLDDTVLTWTLVEDPSKCFDVSASGVVTVKCSDLDHEKTPTVSIRVKVEDLHGGYDTKVITLKVLDIPSPSIDIVRADNPDTSWIDPEIIYTNRESMTLYCSVNGAAGELCADTILIPGRNVIRRELCNVDGYEGCGVDSVVVFYSDAAPEVIVTVNPDAKKATNIYTIVESTDPEDPNVYVNRSKNDILVEVRDSVSGKNTSFTIQVNLDTVSVPKKTYETLASVVKESVALDENPSGGVTRTPVNGSEVEVSYTQKVAGVEVKVSYRTDSKGEVLKQTVVGDKGKEEKMEVMTVSYETVVNGKKVTVSYYADAVTGARLLKDSSGRLLTASAVEDSKDVAAYTVTYDYKDAAGNVAVVTYSVNEKGTQVKNAEGDIGYEVSYTYVNLYGNSATQSVSIVIDRTAPRVEILSPTKSQIVRSNFVDVVWTVNGLEQDSLTVQGLEKGPNVIVRFYRDKAGNEASDTVLVIMKDGKNVEISVEQPVTEIPKDKVNSFYAKNPPKDGQTFAVSIKNPKTLKEVETLIGGDFATTEGSGKEPYPGEKTHLGPTLEMDVRLPVVNGVGGLATLDDLVNSDGMVSLEGVDAAEGAKMPVSEYVEKYCEDGMTYDDASRVNLYKTRLVVKIWTYTTLDNFVDYFAFTQKMDDPDYVNEAGMLQMFFELKPDRDGYVRAENGSMIGTGAYVYKVDATVQSQLRCTLPPVADPSGKKKGDVVRSSDNLLKAFGYKRPFHK